MLFHGSQPQDENAAAAAPARTRLPLGKAAAGAGAAPRARRALGDITNGALNVRAPGKTELGKPAKGLGRDQRSSSAAPAAAPRPTARPLGVPSRAAILAARWAAEGAVEAPAGRTWEEQEAAARRRRDLDAAARLDLLASGIRGRLAARARSWPSEALSCSPPSPAARVPTPLSPPPSPASPPPAAAAAPGSRAAESPLAGLRRLALDEGGARDGDDLCLWEDELWDEDGGVRSRASLGAL